MKILVVMLFALAFQSLANAEQDGSASEQAPASEDTLLRRCLMLLSTIHPGDSYGSVKKLVPELKTEKPDAGDDNTEALATFKVGLIGLKAEFNFSHGHLISHGMETLHLSHAEGHDFLIRCMRILEKLYGPSQRRVDMPWDSDGPPDQIAISFNWHKRHTLLGLDFTMNANIPSCRGGRRRRNERSSRRSGGSWSFRSADFSTGDAVETLPTFPP